MKKFTYRGMVDAIFYHTSDEVIKRRVSSIHMRNIEIDKSLCISMFRNNAGPGKKVAVIVRMKDINNPH